MTYCTPSPTPLFIQFDNSPYTTAFYNHGSTDVHKKAVEDNKSQKKGGSLRKLMLTKNANPSEEKILKAEMVHVIKLALNNESFRRNDETVGY